jgi:hypothetical protein
MKISTLFLLLIGMPAYAAFETYSALDFENCNALVMDNSGGYVPHELTGDYIGPDGPDGKIHKAIVSAVSQYKLDENEYFSIFRGYIDNNKPVKESIHGLCITGTATISCLKEPDFLLSGATYKTIVSKGLQTYECVEGCNGVPTHIYSMGYENMDGESNLEYEEAKENFDKVCLQQPNL